MRLVELVELVELGLACSQIPFGNTLVEETLFRSYNLPFVQNRVFPTEHSQTGVWE